MTIYLFVIIAQAFSFVLFQFVNECFRSRTFQPSLLFLNFIRINTIFQNQITWFCQLVYHRQITLIIGHFKYIIKIQCLHARHLFLPFNLCGWSIQLLNEYESIRMRLKYGWELLCFENSKFWEFRRIACAMYEIEKVAREIAWIIYVRRTCCTRIYRLTQQTFILQTTMVSKIL